MKNYIGYIIAKSSLPAEQTAALTADGKRLSEFSMVFYNNLLSLPFIAVLIWAFGEVSTRWPS